MENNKTRILSRVSYVVSLAVWTLCFLIGPTSPMIPVVKGAEPLTIQIRPDTGETIKFAAEELRDYLGRIFGETLEIRMEESDEGFPKPPSAEETVIRLGLWKDLDIPISDDMAPTLDDAIHLDVADGHGVIAGSNPRSVLFAVYRFLESLGCRWVRPGKDGERIPFLGVKNNPDGQTEIHLTPDTETTGRSTDDDDMTNDSAGDNAKTNGSTSATTALNVHLTDRAFYRFRGSNNCGTYPGEDLLDKIDWSAKMGLNTFFNEFMFPRHLFNRYYSRKYPSFLPDETKSDAEIWVFHRQSIAEIKKRGMLYHAVGHGWTGRVVGAPEEDCDHESQPTPDADKVRFLALHHGERSMRRGPTFTDLCYGNPEVRERLVQLAADYAEHHPEVDYLHFWLDDAINNSCECDLCGETSQSDYYVMILNALDRELTRRGIKTKIVFLLYVELLWAPKTERLEHPERFVMMFAPVSRSYREPYGDEGGKSAKLPEYAKNEFQLPTDVTVNIGLLRQWQRLFNGPAFAFDYHLTWHHYLDFGYYGFTRVLAEDIRRLPQIGMDGCVSCQILNAFFPHGFPVWLHARLLWNPSADFDRLTDDYFHAAFGPNAPEVIRYVSRLSDLSVLTRSPPKDENLRRDFLDRLEETRTVIEDFLEKFYPVCVTQSGGGNDSPAGEETDARDGSALAENDPITARSLELLTLHGRLTLLVIDALRARALQDTDGETAAWRRLALESARTEDQTHGALDLFWFLDQTPAQRIKVHPDDPE